MTNEDTTDFDEHFAKISSYIVDTLHGVPLEMTEDEKEQFRIQVISNQYAERLLSEAEKTETYRGLSKISWLSWKMLDLRAYSQVCKLILLLIYYF